MKMNTLDTVAMALVVVGALNWGLLGLMDMNLVESLLGDFARYVYILVGLAGVAVLYKWYSGMSKR